MTKRLLNKFYNNYYIISRLEYEKLKGGEKTFWQYTKKQLYEDYLEFCEYNKINNIIGKIILSKNSDFTSHRNSKYRFLLIKKKKDIKDINIIKPVLYMTPQFKLELFVKVINKYF
tara:strand:+ start:80 stop:427 length:348 start_codon:yes stop_codon:yes gene_type:complete